RTRDPNHGKVMLYQLSYSRVLKTCAIITYVFKCASIFFNIFEFVVKTFKLLVLSPKLSNVSKNQYVLVGNTRLYIELNINHKVRIAL
ncbi:MAG: hypothetical protein U0L03_00010, partial [Succinivibrionaceae bacterium]|nr:hypothetical protein [Succinivibrionaceae bacterium]